MRKISKINDIPADIYYNQSGIYYKKDSAIFKYNENPIQFLSFNFPFIIEKIDDKNLYIRTKDFLRKISLEDKVKNCDFNFNIVGNKQVKFINDEWFLIRENINDKWFFFKGTFQNEIIWKIPSKESFLFSLFVNKDCILLKEDDGIYCLNTENGEKKWQYSFSELLQGHEIKQYGNIVVYENKLFIYLADNRDAKNLATVSIDINTGKVLNIYKDFAGNLILSDSKMYVASYEMVKTLNLINNEIIEIDFSDILEPLGLRIHWNKSIVQGDYLYFVDGHSYTTNKFGVLDLKSRKLVWNTEIKIDDGINNNIQKIKVIDNKLYVHCSDNSLHIFKIENGYANKSYTRS
jgi:outer membrane protein assembly factor BamB